MEIKKNKIMRYWKKGFYDEPQNGAVEITEEYYSELLTGQSNGYMIEERNDGYPILVEIVPSDIQAVYDELVEKYIREKYTISQEFAVIRQKDDKPDEYQLYYTYAEECKMRARGEIA